MILEFEDIEGKVSVGHVAVPPGLALGEMFDCDARLAGMANSAVRITLNGQPVSDWRAVQPGKGDRVRFLVPPSGPFLGVLQVIVAIISIVSFFISLFNQPKTRKPQTVSPTYSFEGISDVIAPGDPIPVPYGRVRKGGQVLMYYVDVTPNKKGQNMSLLLGMGEGEIDSVESATIVINGLSIADVGSFTMDTRVGLSSQSVIAGFEETKNSFFDGREVQRSTAANTNAIIYASVARGLGDFNPFRGFEIQLAFPEGLFAMRTVGKRAGKTRASPLTYEVAWSNGSPEDHGDPTQWTRARRTIVGNTREKFFDVFAIDANSLNGTVFRPMYLRVIYISARASRPGVDGFRMALQNVTEYTSGLNGAAGSFSGTALLSIRAAATAQLQGGRPNVTAILRGRKVRQYTSLTSFTTGWSENPSWNTLDYITNSVYGMGSWISHGDVNLQSFIDFATLCTSQAITCGEASEDLHHHDMILDVKKPHWGWVEEMLGPYRSSVIYSNGEHKLITDRDDLPVRQVFHSGNMVHQNARVVVGANDPVKPNEVKYVFANEDKDYIQDIQYAQHSQSVLIDNENIKSYEITLNGITRDSEAYRVADTDLQKRRQKIREVTFGTGLEAIAVQAGDIAEVGIPFTDYEAGIGGRALDGSSNFILLDREFDQRSGMTYDMWVWHTSTDTVESRRVNSWGGVRLTVVPTSGFTVPVTPSDRFAIGITSEDLVRTRVLEVGRDESGLHRIRGVEQIRAVFGRFCPAIPADIAFPQAPSQPSTSTITGSGCNACIEATMVSCQGGSFTRASSNINLGREFRLFISSVHNPNASALINDSITVLTGPASGYVFEVASYSGADSFFVQTKFNANSVDGPNSGDSYRIALRSTDFMGFQIYTNPEGGFQNVGLVLGNSGCVDVTGFGENLTIQAAPASSRSLVNTFGQTVTSLFLGGCADLGLQNSAATLTGSADQAFWRVTLPASTLTTSAAMEFDLAGLVSEVCTLGDYTEGKFRLVYGAATLIDSLVVIFNGSGEVTGGVGSAQPFFISGRVDPFAGDANRQIARMSYFGATHSGQMTVERAGTGAQSSTVVNTFGVFLQFLHLNSAGAVESRGCFEAVFQRGEFATIEFE